MTELDIDIDIPDDDDLHALPPILDNGDNPPMWPKLAAGVAIVIAAIVGYGYFTSPDPEPAATPSPTTEPSPASTTTPATAKQPEPEVTHVLAAVTAWERFATTGDLDEVAGSFDSDGPQSALFASQADEDAEPVTVRFKATETGVVRSDGLVTVSTDLTVTSSDDQVTVYPYDFVFLDGSTAVWTVIDRRAAGTQALPPSANTITAIEQTWTALTDALRSGDVATAATYLNAPSTAPAQSFTDTQLSAITDGRLHIWTQINATQVIASLEVDGIDIATVPFVLDGDRWLFDYDTASGFGATP